MTNAVVPSIGGEGRIEFNESFKLPVTLLRDVAVKGGKGGAEGGDAFLKNSLELNLYEPRRDKTAKGQLLATAVVDLADVGVVRECVSVSAPMNSKRSIKNTDKPISTLLVSYVIAFCFVTTGGEKVIYDRILTFASLDDSVFQSIGADVNQKLFRGFATTAAVREGHFEILKILLKAGASQPACHGNAKFVDLLMSSDFIRPHLAVHAIFIACCRGFVDVVDTLMKCGVDATAVDRILLQSSKPSLHTNVDCSALVVEVVSRQVATVRLLLKAGARTDIQVRLGAWSWDIATGEELRVGAGLAEPYPITWCAVEYFEASGSILNLLLQNLSPNTPYYGRTLLHHAILCGNIGAVRALLRSGANVESPVKTTGETMFNPIHMAARLGFSTILQCMIDSGCDINYMTDTGETALMICAKYKHEECLRVLTMAGADFGLVNVVSQFVNSIAVTNRWSHGFQEVLVDIIRTGKIPESSNVSVFSPLMFVAQDGDVGALKVIVDSGEFEIDYQDAKGFSPIMITALEGHVEAFRLLVYAGADVKLSNKSGETAISLSALSQNRDLFEKVMLEFALEKGDLYSGGFYALHCAARRGDIDAAKLLTSRGYDVNVPDGDGYTPLMLAARESYGSMCELLISHGAKLEVMNAKGETPLSLARKRGGLKNDAELARKLVLHGARVLKLTKGGKGSPHAKELRMVGSTGVLRWGKSNQRNVICRVAEVSPSPAFIRDRRSKSDANEAGVKNKEVHFVCEGGVEMAELWVRGITLLTNEAGYFQ